MAEKEYNQDNKKRDKRREKRIFLKELIKDKGTGGTGQWKRKAITQYEVVGQNPRKNDLLKMKKKNPI